jgi:hypothetical protein
MFLSANRRPLRRNMRQLLGSVAAYQLRALVCRIAEADAAAA